MNRNLKTGVIAAGAASIGVLLLFATVHGQMGMMHGRGMMGMSYVRHHYFMRHGVDRRYASKVNPLRPTAENLAEGKALYDQRCALCHGAKGLGNGPAAKGLNPPPADIAALAGMPMATDGYLYWTIAEGGVPLGTPMPPFKDTLKEDQIWKIILYIREL